MWWPLLSERLLHVNLNDVEVQEAEVELAPEALADPDTGDPGGLCSWEADPQVGLPLWPAWRGGSALPTRAIS